MATAKEIKLVTGVTLTLSTEERNFLFDLLGKQPGYPSHSPSNQIYTALRNPSTD